MDIVYTTLRLDETGNRPTMCCLMAHPTASHLHFLMIRVLNACLAMCSFGAVAVVLCGAQASTKRPADVAAAQQAINLAAKGRCREALPRLSATAEG